jgi:PPOX class probable F420-dependent enzyme
MALDDDVRTFISTGRNFAAMTTLFGDGSPQTQVMWVDADTDDVLINTEVHRAKYKNVQVDPRVTVTVIDADNPYRYVEVRGRVTGEVGGAEARAHIDTMAQRYTGKEYVIANIQTERVMLKITPDRVLNNLRRLA